MTSFLHVVGARPNFVKAAPVFRALRSAGVTTQWLVHTGQHYDANLSDDIAQAVGLPTPDVRLEVGAVAAGRQVAAVRVGVAEACARFRPDVLVAYGDVNSTLGATLGAAEAGVAVAHVEAGLRSRDWRMTEELNRILVDHASRWLFATDETAFLNLRTEGVPADRIHVVGNVMADTLLTALSTRAEPGEHAVVTLHRPESVENPEVLRALVSSIARLARRTQVLFPTHPRTRARLDALGLQESLRADGLEFLPPLGYLDMARAVDSARVVVTDSGGLQDECAVLGVPCITLRDTTERPATVACGSNRVVGTAPEAIAAAIEAVWAGPRRVPERPPLWDGHAATRIAEILAPR